MRAKKRHRFAHDATGERTSYPERMTAIAPEAPVLLFDGVCNLCSAAVHFILEREEKPTLQFCALQSEKGRALLEAHKMLHVIAHADPESLVLIEDGQAYERSDAALRIAKHLRAPYRYGRIFLFVPRFLRDLGYRFIAHHRYRFFGKTDSCLVPTKELRARFIA
jgi:predicted DCC family thiol-disulfide oxidoreductase YuxK